MIFLAAWLAVYFNVFFFLVPGNRNFESQGIILEDFPLISTYGLWQQPWLCSFGRGEVRCLYLLLNIYYSNA